MNISTKISQSPTRPESFWKAHHGRHALSALLAFAMVVAGDVAVLKILERESKQPRAVTWQGTPIVDTNAVIGTTNGSKIELGLERDGYVVWRAGP